MFRIKHLLTLTTAVIALCSASLSVAQMIYGESELSHQRSDLREWKGEKTRAEVRAELAAAQRAGQIPHGEAATVAALFDDFTSQKTRAQVRAEMLETRRLGLIPQSGEAAEAQLISPEQAERIRQAGLSAFEGTSVAVAR